MPDVPLTALLDDAAGTFPDRVALSYLGRTLTYRELRAQVDRFRLGVGRARGAQDRPGGVRRDAATRLDPDRRRGDDEPQRRVLREEHAAAVTPVTPVTSISPTG